MHQTVKVREAESALVVDQAWAGLRCKFFVSGGLSVEYTFAMSFPELTYIVGRGGIAFSQIDAMRNLAVTCLQTAHGNLKR